MTRDEYEGRKRRIEEQHRFGTELLEAARQQQLRALDLVWMTTAEGAFGPGGFQPLPPEPSLFLTAAPVAVASVAAPARRVGRPLEDHVAELVAILPSLPELFDRDDVCRALGYEPKRSVLFRVYERLVEQGVLKKVTRGEGRAPSQYKRVEAGVSPKVE